MTRATAIAAYDDSLLENDAEPRNLNTVLSAPNTPFVILSDNAPSVREQLEKDATSRRVTRYLRQLTSFLIVVFVVILALIRVSLMTDHRDRDIAALETMMASQAQTLADNASRYQSEGTLGDADALRAIAHQAVSGFLGRGDIGVEASLSLGGEQITLHGLARDASAERSEGVLEVAAAADGPAGQAQVRILADITSIVAAWQAALITEMTLLAGIGIVVVILGYSFLWQSDRTADANLRSFNASLRLEAALNKGRTGLWDWDLDGGRIDWSNSMFNMLGYAPSGRVLTIDDLDVILHPSNTDLAIKARALRKARKGQLETTVRLLHADGQWRWIHLHAEVIRLPGTKLRLIGAANDITERRRSERKTTEANRHLRESIESVSDAFALWDAKGALVASNTGFNTFNALSRSGDLRGNDGTRLCPFDLELCAAHLMGHEVTPEGLPLDKPLICGLPDDRWFQVSVRSTYDGGFAFLGSDITALKEKEQALVDSESRLIGAIGDLTRSRRDMAALAERYNEERNRAEAASRAKSEFLANMSHELRTPLNAIIGFSELMRSEILGPIGSAAYSGYASDIHASGQFLLGVISDVLDMAKLDTNRVTIVPRAENVADAVRECVRMVQLDADKAGVAITCDVDRTQVVEADPHAIRQVILNLLNNAVKFTPKGGNISVRSRIKGGKLFLSVRDTGIGIPRDKINKVTEPFEQVHSAMTRPREGSGLGLAISCKLVDLHHGSLKISSREHVGTLVGIALPVVQPRTQSLQQANAASAGEDISGAAVRVEQRASTGGMAHSAHGAAGHTAAARVA